MAWHTRLALEELPVCPTACPHAEPVSGPHKGPLLAAESVEADLSRLKPRCHAGRVKEGAWAEGLPAAPSPAPCLSLLVRLTVPRGLL